MSDNTQAEGQKPINLPINVYDLKTNQVEGYEPGFYYSLASQEENPDVEIRVWGPFESAEDAFQAGLSHLSQVFVAIVGGGQMSTPDGDREVCEKEIA